MNRQVTCEEDYPLTLTGRVAHSVKNRQLGRFFAELVLIVAGILIALAIDDWVSDVRDRDSEVLYLELLARDIDQIGREAQAQVEFEKDKIDTGARAYAALSAPDPAANKVELGELLGLLNSRRTLNLNSATFDQMVSSGHLQLIRNETLRDKLVRYFDQMERLERIAEKNNRDLMDYVYIPFLMRAGITVQSRARESAANLNRAAEILHASLGPNTVYPEDRVLSQPPGADSWNDIRRNVLFRTRMAAVGQALAEQIIADSDSMAAAVLAELVDG